MGAPCGICKGRFGPIRYDEPSDAQKVCALAFEQGLLAETSGPSDEVVKLLPPLTISREDLDRGLSILSDAVKEVIG